MIDGVLAAERPTTQCHLMQVLTLQIIVSIAPSRLEQWVVIEQDGVTVMRALVILIQVTERLTRGQPGGKR